jgi:transposase-like protein
LTAIAGKHPSTIFTDQDAAMAGAIAYVFPNTRHRICLWHIYLNVAKHLSRVIHEHPHEFLPAFKKCVYEDRSEECFKKRFRRKLGLSELIVECEKVSASLWENELDEDFKSRMNNPVNYIPNFSIVEDCS